MKKLLTLVWIVITFSTNYAMAQTDDELKLRYTKVPDGYIIVLRQGDDILNSLERIAQKEQIPFANFTGIGFVNITFGFFDFKTKQYKPKEFKDVEMASMTGSIAWQDNKISIHAHGVVTDKDFKAYGGHILSGTVSTGSLEIYATVHNKQFERKYDSTIGANVLSLE